VRTASPGVTLEIVMRPVSSWFAVTFVFAFAFAGCGSPPGDMHPGDDCGACHTGAKAPRFGIAGTAYADPGASNDQGTSGVTVSVTDSNGQAATLESNDVGNFYTKAALTPPLQVTVTRNGSSVSMADAPSGFCNSCHTPGSAVAPGHVYVP
jgi:hypothetical protein